MGLRGSCKCVILPLSYENTVNLALVENFGLMKKLWLMQILTYEGQKTIEKKDKGLYRILN